MSAIVRRTAVVVTPGTIPSRALPYARGVTVYDLSLPTLTDRLTAWGEPAFRAKQVYAQLWKRAAAYEEMSDVPPALRERLATDLPLGVEVLDERTADRGATRKSLLRLGEAGHVIETVLMGYPDRVTVCVSSQVGCAMGCGFCATGQMGLESNLTAGEIAAQVVWAMREATRLPESTPQRLTNVVFMGMGEPLMNRRHVFAALTLLNAAYGLGARRITISTVGVVPGILELAERPEQFRLAVSLHAPTHELRQEIVPIEKKHPLPELMDALRRFEEAGGRRITFEYVMIDGFNDAPEHARALVTLIRGFPSHVNLIPYNPIPGPDWKTSKPAAMQRFQRVLEDSGIAATIRTPRGKDIAAACGQLRAEHAVKPPRPYVELTRRRKMEEV